MFNDGQVAFITPADRVRLAHPARGRGISRLPRAVLALAPVLALLGGCACDLPQDHLASLVGAGDYRAARDLLADPEVERCYGTKDYLLLRLERGAVALSAGDAAGAIRSLDEAEGASAYNYDPAAGDVLAQWAVNDRAARYFAQPHEDQYVNVLKMLALLAEGDARGAAVEANRFRDKAGELRARHGAFMDAYARRGATARASGADSGRFVESTLGAYLGAVAFMKSGLSGAAEDQAHLAGHLADAAERQSAIVGQIDPAIAGAVGSAAPESANVLVVALCGRGPTRVSRDRRFQGDGWSAATPFPDLVQNPTRVTAVRFEVEGGPGFDLPLVEDLAGVATENFRRSLDLIEARTALRLAAKAGVVAGATIAAASNRDSEPFALLVGAAGLLWIEATERPDLRHWVSLPGRAHAGLAHLPPGEHRARAVFMHGADVLETTPWTVLRAGGGTLDLATVVLRTPR